jgi:antibiotic biosynthesis monooxygenase (ABM) superfamily enzyme
MAGIRSWGCNELRLADCERGKETTIMIARMWHGWTKAADAKTYEDMLRDEIFPSIAARNISGYHGAELFIRDGGDEVEFVTLLRFDSMDAVKEFAGADESKPVIYPKAESLLTRMDERSQHYRVAV